MPRKKKYPSRIAVIFPNIQDKGKMAVYRLSLGEKYYIGSTANTTNRAAWHQTSINRSFLSDWRPGKNSKTKMKEYLQEHPEIVILTIEVVRIVESEDDLVNAEQAEFNRCCFDENCLNFRMTAFRRIGDRKVRPTNIAEWVPRR